MTKSILKIHPIFWLIILFIMKFLKLSIIIMQKLFLI